MAARVAAHTRWANCADPSSATRAARSGFDKRFYDQADPDGSARARIAQLGPDSAEGGAMSEALNRKAAHLRKVYFTRLALASAKARRKS